MQIIERLESTHRLFCQTEPGSYGYFIVSHGGQIETFLSKDVTHILVDGNKDCLKQNTGTIPDAFKNTRGGNILSASLTA